MVVKSFQFRCGSGLPCIEKHIGFVLTKADSSGQSKGFPQDRLSSSFGNLTAIHLHFLFLLMTLHFVPAKADSCESSL